MKKNLLSLLILALLVVDIALTAIMMVSVISTNKKTNDLVSSAATAMNMELYYPGGESASSVPLSQTETYSLADRLMIQIKQDVGADGKAVGHGMVIFYMSLAMDTKHEDYANLGSAEKLAGLEIDIKDAVSKVVRDYTEQEIKDNEEQLKEDILIAIQNLFQSRFIYKVSISDVIFQ